MKRKPSDGGTLVPKHLQAAFRELLKGPPRVLRLPKATLFQTCPRCLRMQPVSRLNIEGRIHHGVAAECLDRKDCERAKRKRLR